MRQVYVSGALTNVPEPERLKGFYERIGQMCNELGLVSYVPHLHTDPQSHPHVTPREVYTRDKFHVSTSGLVIAYLGVASFGVGMELAYADAAGIPIVILYEQDAVISRFPRGLPQLVAEICFSDEPDALRQLRVTLERFIQGSQSETPDTSV